MQGLPTFVPGLQPSDWRYFWERSPRFVFSGYSLAVSAFPCRRTILNGK